MKRFFKFPIRIYKSSDIEKYVETVINKDEPDKEKDFDKWVEWYNNQKEDSEEEEIPEGHDVECRIDPEKIIYYRPVWGLESTEEEIEFGIFNNTLVVIEGEEFICSWKIEEFESHLFNEK